MWSFLIPFKSAAQVIPRSSLVAEMLANADVARFVTALLPNAIKNGYAHRTLVAFNAANLHDYITSSAVLDQGLLAFLLPALLEPLHETSSSKDCIVSVFLYKCYHLLIVIQLGSYILLCTLSHKCHLSPKALSLIMASMIRRARVAGYTHFIKTVVSVCEPQDELESFPEVADKDFLQIPCVFSFSWVVLSLRDFVAVV
jgi:U3 small nucleolar RNA-associated protein 10